MREVRCDFAHATEVVTRGQNAIPVFILPRRLGAFCPRYSFGSGGARGGTGEDCTIEVVVLP
jgi:hypothetical protein